MKKTNLIFKLTVAAVFFTIIIINADSQNRVKLGVISIDTKGLNYDNQTMANMVHLELEKANVFEVLCKYDAEQLVKNKGINVNECFGKTCLIQIGEILGADKMLSGSAEKFGNKIIFVLRLIDVKKGVIEKTDVMEYINQQDQLQTMVRVSINNIIEEENDKFLLDLLVNYDVPITTSRTTLNLNGPRVGFYMAFDQTKERMTACKSDGGFGMYPVTSLIGYQYERQFLSSGDFQALVELLPTVSGMESGMIIPSLTTMLGFRFSKTGLEFGLGPVIRVSKMAYGYYDDNRTWHLRSDVPEDIWDEFYFIKQIDSRGSFGVSTGMIFAFGKTFRSGYLNMPVNLYFSPTQNGSTVGVIVGFNIANSPMIFSKKEK